MASLSKEQKEQIIKELSHTFGTVMLKCDDDHITLAVERVKPLQHKVVMYINGYWKAEWCNDKKSYPEQKYLRKREHSLYSKAEVAEFQKKFGKRDAARIFDLKKTFFTFNLVWPSGKMALNHLIKVSKSIELVKVGILDFEYQTVSELEHEPNS